MRGELEGVEQQGGRERVWPGSTTTSQDSRGGYSNARDGAQNNAGYEVSAPTGQGITRGSTHRTTCDADIPPLREAETDTHYHWNGAIYRPEAARSPTFLEVGPENA